MAISIMEENSGRRSELREKLDLDAQTGPWAALPPNSGWPWPHDYTSDLS